MRLIAIAALLVASTAVAQQGFGPLDPAKPATQTPEQIIQAFAAKETQFAHARANYTWTQSVKFDTLGDNGKPDGEYYQVTDIGFKDDGTRLENVTFAPQNTITRLILTREDFDDLERRLPFVLTTDDLPEYNVTYVGRQKVDELDTYVFDIEPKMLEKNHRYFKGKVWVDQADLEIVLASGKNVPDDVRHGHENLSPPFTTYYEQIDGRYWFPTYTKAEGTLHFSAQNGSMGQDTAVRSIVKYTDYKQFHARTRILYNGQDIPNAQPDAQPQQPPKK